MTTIFKIFVVCIQTKAVYYQTMVNFHHTVQRPLKTWSMVNFHHNQHNRHPKAPIRARYGVSFVSASPDGCSATVPEVVYASPCYIALCYYGTPLYCVLIYYDIALSWHCKSSLQWHHNGCDGASNHQPCDCLPNHLFRRKSKKTSKLCVTGLCGGKRNPHTNGQ